MHHLVLDDASSTIWPWGQVSVLETMCHLAPDGGELSLSHIHAAGDKHTRSQTRRALLALVARGVIELVSDSDDEPVFAHPGASSAKLISSQRYSRQLKHQRSKGIFKPLLHRRSRLSALAKR